MKKKYPLNNNKEIDNKGENYPYKKKKRNYIFSM